MSAQSESEFIQGLVDEILTGYEELPPELRAQIRDHLTDYFTFFPRGKDLVRQARPDPTVLANGEVPRVVLPGAPICHQPTDGAATPRARNRLASRSRISVWRRRVVR